jgi:hypothetical protein
MPEQKYFLVDPDNRDDNGASFEFTGDAERVIKYLDGPVRRDVREESRFNVDAAIAALRAGSLEAAEPFARNVGVYIHPAERTADA